MDKNQLEKERLKQKLEALLREGLESGKATAFTRADFDEIKRRGMARLKAKETRKNLS